MSKYTETTWSYKPVFTKEQVEKITKKATLWQKFKLLFVKSHYSIDGKAMIRYKKMGDKVYVMKRGTHL